MQALLRKLLNLQPGEGRKLVVLYLLGFVVATSLVWGQSIGRALFLKRIGVEWLPLMFIFEALLTFLIAIVYTSFVDRVSNARLLAVIFGGVGIVLLAAWGLLFLDREGVVVPYVILVYALFYLAERVLRALFGVHVWTLYDDYLDIRSAKRLLPILGSNSRTAGILSGALLSLLTAFLPVETLVLIWIAVLALGAWLSLSVPRWLAADANRPSGPGSEGRSRFPLKAGAAKTRPALSGYWANLSGGFRFVSASAFLKLLAIGAFAMTALLALIDYQTSRILVQAYPSAERLTAFYGLLESVTNVVALPFQMLLLSRLVTWLGVAQANLIFPFGTLLVYAVLSAWPGLGTAIAGQASRDVFRTSVQSPVDNMLYNAVPPQVKGRARAFVKGLLVPLANIAIGLLLLPIRQAGSLPYWLLAIGGVMALIQVTAAFLVRRRYTQALVTMLEAEDFSAYRAAMLASTGSDLGVSDPATFQRLLQQLRASQDEDSLLFLSRIVAQVGGRGACALLVDVAEQASPAVRAGILETIVESDIVDRAADDLGRRCLAAGEPHLRRAALAVQERLLGSANPALWDLAAPLLDDPDPETRLPAILLLVRSGDFFYLSAAVRSLNDLLDDKVHADRRVAGLRALQAIGDSRLVRSLARYIDDPDDGVRLQAAQVLEALADAHAPGWAVALAREAVKRQLADPVEGVRLSALHTLGKLGGTEALDPLLAALADPSELVRGQAEQDLALLGPVGVPTLEGLLEAGHSSEQVALAAAAVLARMARDRILDGGEAQHHLRRAENLFEDLLRRIYTDAQLIVALDDLKPAPAPAARAGLPGLDALAAIGRRSRAAHQAPAARPSQPSNGDLARSLLRDGLNERNERRLEGAFRLLSATLRHPPSTVEVILHKLQDPSAGMQARVNALEALESLTTPRLTRLVGQATPTRATAAADLVAAGREEWDLEPLTPPQALESILAGPDRWLAAVAIILAAQDRLLEVDAVRSTWLPLWQADLDLAVREAACYAARRLELETDMIDNTPTPALPSVDGAESPGLNGGQTLSAVERALFLRQVPFFAAMTVEQLRTLAGIAVEQYHDPGQVIYDEGEPGEAIYVIVSGRVGIECEPKQGRVQRLETLAARQYFGERTIFDGAAHETRAVALDRLHLLCIRRDHLLILIRRTPDLSLSLVTVLSQRLREADAMLASRTRSKPDQVMRLYDKLTGEMEND
jgi:CRP-like cAMP-binding protein/HEAT repeat protein